MELRSITSVQFYSNYPFSGIWEANLGPGVESNISTRLGFSLHVTIPNGVYPLAPV